MMKKIAVAIGAFLLVVLIYIVTVGNINDVGLKVLSWTKKLSGNAVALSSLSKEERPVLNHDIWTDLLQLHVDSMGLVNYQGFMDDNHKMSQYLELLSNNPPGANWNEEDQMAYWINAYNAFTVKLIMDHYPLKSINDIKDGLPMINSPWDIKFFNIGGVSFDLNTIEHSILRKDFQEPRIHFAINCASYSCPKLRREAYFGHKLEHQLDDQTRVFIDDKSRNDLSENQTKISKIFSWFQSDFEKNGSDVHSFIQNHFPSLNGNVEVEFLDYDWRLNE